MLLSESEAVLKICPDLNVPGYSFNLSNSSGGAFSGALYPNGTTASCVASRCMAWRWGDDMKTKGYCGKAGRP
jgi:hypothetical protein